MTEYARWEQLDVDVMSLVLDPLNPRLGDFSNVPTQREIIAELIEHEDVYELAKQIATQGYYPTEVPVVIEEAGELRVVEGNRRVASLQLLTSPALAPDTRVTAFRKIATKAIRPPKSLPVIKAPSRADTVPLIMNRHNRQGVKGWDPIQQSKYVISLREGGMPIEALAEATGFTRSAILGFVRTHTMYEVATSLPLDQKTKKIVQDPRSFNISALERVIGSKKMREFLGIALDQEGGIVGHVAPKEFRKAFIRIVHDIAHRKVDTRELNNEHGFERYISRISAVAPDLGKTGSFSAEDLIKNSPRREEKATEHEPVKRKLRPYQYLAPRAIKSGLQMHRINEILRELQTLKVDGFENAVAVELRIFIELCISHYLESTGKMEPLVAKLDKKNQKPRDWTPSLRQMLNELLTADPNINIPRQARKALSKAVSDDDWPLSLDGMDQFVHNPYTAPTERQLRQFWNAFESLVEYLLVDHSPAGKP
jgi:hypothetical protein